jgi:SPP1 family predicted phage head-tail adaptor
MRAGRLNALVVIQRPAAGQDSAGQPNVGFVNLDAAGDGSTWAQIRHLNGLETLRAGAAPSVVRASIRIRYRTDVTARMRVVYGSTVYEIKAVLPDEERKQHVDLVCEVVG